MKRIHKHLTILPAVAALLLSAACSNDDMDGLSANGLVAAQVTADISNGQSATRTSTDGTTASFMEGDEIHVVASETTYDYTKQSDGTWAATTPYYFQNSEDVSFQGWYSTTAASGNSISINTTSQTITNGWNEWDILATPMVTTNVSSPTVNFTSSNNAAFQHVMSQATFTFTAGDGVSDLSALTQYTLGILTTDATFNTLTCELTKGNTTGSITQEFAEVSGKEVVSTIILVPQTVTSDFSLEVTYNGQTYTTDLALPDDAEALKEGTHYAFNVTISNTGLTVNSAEIKSWTTQEAETSSASLKGYTYNEGTNTYTVYSETGLLAWAEYTLSGHWDTNCTLANDITLSIVNDGESNWTAVGDGSNQYTGTFDGNGHTISGLTINGTSSSNQGLIGYLGSAGVVKNLTLAEVGISITNGDYIGAVVGRNRGSVTNCSASGTITGYNYVGGVVGANSGGIVTASYFTGTVTGTGNLSTTGGVVGTNMEGTITACYSTGTVSGEYNTGGVVGRNYGIVTACYSTGSVAGNSYVGGVVGYNRGTVTACYSTGSVSATFYAGGVTGGNWEGTVTACYATGSITGSGSYIGGVVGRSYNGTAITCYWANSSSDTGAASYGIGYDENNATATNEGATKVEGTVTWADAATEMNKELTDWEYVENEDSTDPPLLLVESTTTE